MRFLLTIHATVDNSPVEIQGVVSARSHNGNKIQSIYDRFFRDNQAFKSNDNSFDATLYELKSLDCLSSEQLEEYKGNAIKYSKIKGITGKFKIIVPSLQYNLRGL